MPNIHTTCKRLWVSLSCVLLLVGSLPLRSLAGNADTALETARNMTVQSNEVVNWPSGPIISAESAILIEADTGTILYEKNSHQKVYPASTTKILTTLIAAEQCKLDEVVRFSKAAVFDTPRNSNHIAMDVGQTLTMEQCLNAILIRSANEVSYAVAEHISGTSDWSVFAEMMNKRAKELGAIESNFVNPNGLPDDNHYTSAYDLVQIGKAFFANEMLCQITLTRRLEIPASDTVPQTKIENNAMQIIPGGKYAYEYLIGCKTGYTDAARSCLVSAAEKDGMRLICAVMKDEAPYQYEDTISLFNYGFSNFEKVNIALSDNKYNITTSDMFYSGNDILGSSKPLLSLNEEDYIIMPRTATLNQIDSKIIYDSESSDQAATISYSYHGVSLGTVRLMFAEEEDPSYEFEVTMADAQDLETADTSNGAVFINILRVLAVAGGVALLLFVILLINAFRKRYAFFPGSKRRAWRKANKHRRKKRQEVNLSSKYRDYDS